MAAIATGCGGINDNAMRCGGGGDEDQEIWLAEEEGGSTTARRAGGAEAEAEDVDAGYSMEDW